MSDQDPAGLNQESGGVQGHATQPPYGGEPGSQSRRAFLRATVIGSAAVAATGAVVVAASGLGPSLLTSVGVAKAAFSNPNTCVTLIEGFHPANSNNSLIIQGSSASDPGPAAFPTGTCFRLIDKTSKNQPILYGQIAAGSMLKQGTSDHWQMPITVFNYKDTGTATCTMTPPNGNYPEGSSLCEAPCGLNCAQI
jgi:hypothetical protein